MPVYADAEQLYNVLRRVFDIVREHPDAIESFTSSNLVIRLRLTEPDAVVLLDGRQPPWKSSLARGRVKRISN